MTYFSDIIPEISEQAHSTDIHIQIDRQVGRQVNRQVNKQQLHLSIYLPTYLPIYLPIYLFTHLPTYLPIYLCTYLPTYLPARPIEIQVAVSPSAKKCIYVYLRPHPQLSDASVCFLLILIHLPIYLDDRLVNLSRFQ